MTRQEARCTVSYESGDVVRADREYKTLGLARGDYARVVDGPAGVVRLERTDGQHVSWHPTIQTNMSAFTEHRREVAVGDIVRFTSNDYRAGLINGDRATVVAVEPERDRLLVQRSDGTRQALSTDGPLFVEHGYCQTVHGAQSKTCKRVLIEAPAANAMGNESQYYVSISRATHHAVLYTDDAERLPQALSREDVKAAALEVH